jgi:hypothetical protein
MKKCRSKHEKFITCRNVLVEAFKKELSKFGFRQIAGFILKLLNLQL